MSNLNDYFALGTRNRGSVFASGGPTLRSQLFLVTSIALTLLTVQPAFGQVTIDDFTQGPEIIGPFQSGTLDNGTQTGLPTANVLGGSRFISGTVEANIDGLNMLLGVVDSNFNRFFYANDPGVDGHAFLRFDADGAGLNFNAMMATGIELQFTSNDMEGADRLWPAQHLPAEASAVPVRCRD